MKGPLVSVVMPVFNGERFLAQSIESVIRQDYRSIEIIIVDDGSTDKSAEIASSFSGVRCVYQENRGNANARNRGIELAKGEFIAFIDQDDLWVPHKVSVHIKYLLEHIDIVFTVAHIRHFLETGMEKPAWLRQDLLDKTRPDFAPGSLVARKSAFELVGKFNEHYKTSSDVDWFYLANDKKVPMVVLSDVLIHKRVHQSNLSAMVGQTHKELLKIIRESINRKKNKA